MYMYVYLAVHSTPHSTPLHSTTLYHTTLSILPLCFTTTLHYTTLQLHYNTLQSTPLHYHYTPSVLQEHCKLIKREWSLCYTTLQHSYQKITASTWYSNTPIYMYNLNHSKHKRTVQIPCSLWVKEVQWCHQDSQESCFQQEDVPVPTKITNVKSTYPFYNPTFLYSSTFYRCICFCFSDFAQHKRNLTT